MSTKKLSGGTTSPQPCFFNRDAMPLDARPLSSAEMSARVSYAAALPGLALLVFAPGAAFVLGVAWTGLAINLPFSLHVTLGQDYLPHRIGTASGVTLGLAVSVGGAATPLFGVLADAHGLTWSLAALLPLPVLALLVSLRLPARTSSSPEVRRASPTERAAPHR